MYPKMNSRAWRVPVALALSMSVSGGTVLAAGLTLHAAEQLALKNDYTLQAIEARGESMQERSVAAAQLPDPQFKIGFANLPTDTFRLDQEPMTQAVVGLRQAFPRGRTLALSGERLRESAARNDAEAQDRRQQVLLEVRKAFTQVYLHRRRQEILRQSEAVFSDLAAITRDYYASGRAHQQDVVQARLELSKVEERLSRIRQDEQEARAKLAGWIGAAAWGEIDSRWPQLAQPAKAQVIIDGLKNHPRLLAWQHEIERSRTTEDIARQAYKPGFAVDLSYGGRAGENMDGSSRADLFSVMVTMDVPLFTKNRQDRMLASDIAATAATRYARDDTYRSMKASVETYAASLEHEQERLRMYKDTLLPQAAYNAETAFEDYQDAVNDLTTLLRARIGEYELKLSDAALRADEIITRAQLLYLQGETS